MNNKPRNLWYIERQIIMQELGVFHIVEGQHGNPDQLVTFEATAHPMDSAVTNPHGASWRWTEGEAQQIMDGLWQAGIRPQNGTGSGAQVEALLAHLADLRALLFAVQEVERP